jgi:hypothetical protein
MIGLHRYISAFSLREKSEANPTQIFLQLVASDLHMGFMPCTEQFLLFQSRGPTVSAFQVFSQVIY